MREHLVELYKLREHARHESRSWGVQVAECLRDPKRKHALEFALELYVEAAQQQALADDLISLETYGVFWARVTAERIKERSVRRRAEAAETAGHAADALGYVLGGAAR